LNEDQQSSCNNIFIKGTIPERGLLTMFSKEETKMIDLGRTSIDENFDEGVSQALDFLTKIGTATSVKKTSSKLEKWLFL